RSGTLAPILRDAHMRDETPKQGQAQAGSPASETGQGAGGVTRQNTSVRPGRAGALPTEPEMRSGFVAGYEVLDELGRGAMGVVYRARHVKLNRIVALKMVVGTRVDEKDLIRFLAEAEAVAAVKHENVVEVYDYGESEG